MNHYFSTIPKNITLIELIINFNIKSSSESIRKELVNFCKSILSLND